MGLYELAQLLFAVLWGLGAALLPVFVNAEVYVLALAVKVDSKPFLALLLVVHVAATTVGKAFVFQLARKGTNKVRMATPKPPKNAFSAWLRGVGRRISRSAVGRGLKRLSDWLLALLDRPYPGGLTTFLSSLIGVPPLAIVTILAGASKQPLGVFLTMVFAGRLIQFLAIAFLLHQVSWL